MILYFFNQLLVLVESSCLFFPLQLIVQDHAHDHTHKADDQTAKNSGPKAIHAESEAKSLPDPTGEQ